MTGPRSQDDAREQQLTEVLLAYVEALEQGRTPDRGRLLAEHPDLAAELTEFFADRDRVELMAAPLRQAGRANGRPGSRSGFLAALTQDMHNSPPGQEAAPALPPPAAELGRLGDFRLLREVGRGGMGVVYEAEQISLNRRVALKVLPFAAALDSRQLQRFKNEAQAAALLHHPNIVPVYAVGAERAVHYYAMQFIEGQSLAALLDDLRRQEEGEAPGSGDKETRGRGEKERGKPGDRETKRQKMPGNGSMPGSGAPYLPGSSAFSAERSAQRPAYFRRVAGLIRKAAEGLEHAHQLGVVHRDIKPGNILLDERGNPWITDFGLALLQNDAGLTSTGELVGTLRYMSPEQASAQRSLVDHRTDIYSLGVTLYELLTLKPLFDGTESSRLLQQITSEEPCPPRSLDRSIPVELETIVLKAIAKAPAERYATAQELAEDLGRFLDDQPVRARRPTLLDRARKWSRRHKTVVVSALVLLFLATAGLLVSTILIAQANGEVKAALARERRKTTEAEQQRARAEANFLQARRAVDFLVQVSAKELVNKPGVLDVRRKLLEGALEYYQGFLDQDPDDPAVQAQLAASYDRANQILKDLAAEQDYHQLMAQIRLLKNKAVQEDLGVDAAQKKAIGQASRGPLREPGFQEFLKLGERPEAERVRKFKEMAAAHERTIAALLKPQQARRLKQIALQQRGLQAFSDAEVTLALNLTSEQKTRIRDIQDRTYRELRKNFRPWDREHGAERYEKNQRLLKEAGKDILAVLTKKQQADWKALRGKPFAGKLPRPFDFAFSGKRPGGWEGGQAFGAKVWEGNGLKNNHRSRFRK